METGIELVVRVLVAAPRSVRASGAPHHVLLPESGFSDQCADDLVEGLGLAVSLPKISSAQLMPHGGTHEALHRVGRVVVCQGWRFRSEPPVARAVAGAGGRSRCPDAAGARCRKA